ncbi:MAG: ATP-binding protein, partial [Ignavibacteriaceae bacterium]|nr:ATP-binding protein [Ignavibacteriaceae bacterium]
MGKKLIFQPKARLLLQLGDQLIRNESIALIELVKNSYDAFATSVVVLMKKVDNQKEGEIVIIDNGIGMNADIIEKVWMQPGSDNKLKIIKSIINVDDNIRIPIGEKGIGRFGVHKLGYDIELVSKAEGSKEVFLKIDWTEFEKDDLLKNKKITLITRNAKVFTEGKTGTRIRINNLRHAWTRSEVRELHRAVISLSSPFGKIDKFKVNFKIDNQQWLTGLLKFEDIKKYALYYANVEILNSVIKKLAYEFRPVSYTHL